MSLAIGSRVFQATSGKMKNFINQAGRQFLYSSRFALRKAGRELVKRACQFLGTQGIDVLTQVADRINHAQ
jgi:hypothetical protein